MRINDEHFQKWSFIDVQMMITKVWSLPGLATVAGLSLLLALVVVTFHQVQSQPRHRGEAETEKGVSCHSLITSSEEWGVRCCVRAPRIPGAGSRPPPASRWGRPGRPGRGGAGARARGRAQAQWGVEWSPTSRRPRPVREYSARKNVMPSNVSLKG